MPSLRDKVAIVTGSSRGIGRAIAERFAADGAAVVVNYARSEDEARSVVAAIEAKGGTAFAVQADAGVVADIRRLFRTTLAKFGHVDIVVNNAGALGNPKPIAEITEQEFDSTFADQYWLREPIEHILMLIGIASTYRNISELYDRMAEK